MRQLLQESQLLRILEIIAVRLKALLIGQESTLPESVVGIGYCSLVGNCLMLRPKRQGQANAPRKGDPPPPRKART